MQPLYESYRPRQWSDVVGQDKALARLDTLRRRGLESKIYWITGQSGTGKTTIARLIAEEVADPYIVEEMDGGKLLTARVDQIERQCHGRPIGGRPWCFIVNEAHRITSNIVGRLNTTFEIAVVQRNSTWIFTTTNQGEAKLFDDEIETSPFSSRVQALALARRGLAECKNDHGKKQPGPFALRAQAIARAENLDGRPIADYIALVKRCRNNLRMAIQEIEAGAMLSDQGTAKCPADSV